MKIALVTLTAVHLLAAATVASPLKGPHPQPTFEEFQAKVGANYSASEVRRNQIKRAGRTLRVKQTEAEIMTLLGVPDYKGLVFDRDGIKSGVPHHEYWFYIIDMGHGATPDDDHFLRISLRYKSKPRRIDAILLWPPKPNA